MTKAATTYLPDALPVPASDGDGLQAPFWSGLEREELLIQRCRHCRTWVFAPEWICHQCHSFDLDWTAVEPTGVIYSWTRVWHPVTPAIAEHMPYLVGVIELPQAGNVRLIGNLLGDPAKAVEIGARVRGVFEHHPAAADNPARKAFTLLQWTPA